MAQASHAADLRGLSARLTAQREMMLSIFEDALHASENGEADGAYSSSIRPLERH